MKFSLPVNAKWSFSALNVRTGKEILNTGNAADVPLISGSLTKLFITAAALDMESRETILMDTIIAADGANSEGTLHGNLYIKGSGNAFLSEVDLEFAVEEIRSKGIKEIQGDIIADDSLFDTKGEESRYQGPAYASPGALGLYLHTISITLYGRPPTIKIEPANDAVKVVRLASSEHPSIRQIDDFTYEVRGDISDSAVLRKRFSLKDPSLYAAWTIKTRLREKGISHEGSIRKGRISPGAAEIYTIKAKALSEIIRDTNYNSLNVVAENLLLLIGAKKYGPPGTLRKGIMAVREFLNGTGLSLGESGFADGSGLSHDNRITSAQMVAFLKKVSEKKWFKTFYESLPRAGMDGTLKHIGYKNADIRAKTGRLSDVFCIAGYAEGKNKEMMAFSYMVNVPGAELVGKDAIGLLLARIAGEEL